MSSATVRQGLPSEVGVGSQLYKSTSFNKVFKVMYEEVKPVYRGYVNDYSYALSGTERLQSMEGFDDCYRDIVDYILKCTYRIWQEGNIGLLYTHYANNTEINNNTIRTSHGIEDTISGTMQMLHAFPDRRAKQQYVIWSGNDQEGFYSSHRSISIATNTGDSIYGPATGKKVRFFAVADCVVYRNRIMREWLIRDALYLVKQLGLDPIEAAKKMAKAYRYKLPPLQRTFGFSEAMDGEYVPPVYVPNNQDPGKFDIGDFIMEMFNRVHQWKMLGDIKDYYADNALMHYVCDEDALGLTEIKQTLMSFYAGFANAEVIVERVTCNQLSEGEDWDVAVRWRVQGMNEGIGYFGEPSHKQIEVLVITHYMVANKKIVEEWMMFDGMDVLRQMYTDDGDMQDATSISND